MTDNEVRTPENAQLVGMQAGKIVVLAPKRQMSRQEAIDHAAWLVAMVTILGRGDAKDEFLAAYDALL